MENKQKVFLVSIELPEDKDVLISLNELEKLVETAGGEVVGRIIQKRDSIHPQTCIGTGKIDEVKTLANDLLADLVVFDLDLSPVQNFNIEKRLEIDVIDRTILIMDIFAQRARTSEGKLQVELAQLQYMLPRLKGSYESMSKLGGGIGSRGPGETKLETDKRHIKRKITYLKKKLELSNIRRNNERQKLKRDYKLVTIAGYTNAGKSTLLNSLTDSDVYAEDKLFATLDPSFRMLKLEDNSVAYIADTVGFIRKLPHNLIDAFKSTLDIIKEADLVLYVCDSSSLELDSETAVSLNLINEIGYTGKIITVFNKYDKINDNKELSFSPDSCFVSALHKSGLSELKKLILKNITKQKYLVNLQIPYEKSKNVSYIIENYTVLKTEYQNEAVIMNVEMDENGINKFNEFIFNS